MLSHPIVKCIIAKVPEKQQGMQSLKTAINKTDLTEAMFLIKEKAVYHQIDTEKWFSIEELKSLVPTGMVSNGEINSGRVYQKNESEFEYFVKILDQYDEKEIPPFEYIESKITKSILSERKNNLLKQYRTELYDKGKENGDFEIFIAK